MKRWLSNLIDVRKGEVFITTLMVLYIYTILLVYYLLKPARDSLFLSNAGPELLPLVFVLIAVVVVPITTIYSRLSRAFKLNQLINITTIIIIINLVLLRWLLAFKGQEWVFFVFYIWVSIYGALITSQFWLLANAVFDAAQAKRIFVLFSLGAIIGAFSGGGVTSFIVTNLGVSTEDLLYFCMGFLAFCIPLVNLVWIKSRANDHPMRTRREKKEEKQESWTQMFADMKGSRHLVLIMGIIAMTMATASFVDYQFKFVSTDAYSVYQLSEEHIAILQEEGLPAEAAQALTELIGQRFENREDFFSRIRASLSKDNYRNHKARIIKLSTTTDKEAFTSFLGQFYGGLSLLGFLFQLLFSYRAIRLLGVGGVILFLPLSLFVASMGMLLAPGLIAGVLLRGSDGTFKYSIDKTARELLFLPIPLDVKKRSKMFIDLFIDRVFRGISGLILLFITLQLELTMRQISMVVLVLLAIWIGLDLMVRKEYVNAFRKALDKGTIDPDSLTIKIDDAAAINTLLQVLEGDNERQIIYALELLRDVHDKNLTEKVKPFLKHTSAQVRQKALKFFQEQPDEAAREPIQQLLDDPHPDVRIEAVRFLYLTTDENRLHLLKTLLADHQPAHCSAALGYIGAYGSKEEQALIDNRFIEDVMQRNQDECADIQVLAARAIGQLQDVRLHGYLKNMLSHPNPEVCREVIRSMGKTRNREFLTPLLNLLSDKRYRGDAREALSMFGNRIIGTLQDHLLDPQVDMRIRLNIPRVFSSILTQESVDALIQLAEKTEPVLRERVFRALNRLRRKQPELVFAPRQMETLLTQNARRYFQLHQIKTLLDEGSLAIAGDDSEPLILQALREKLHRIRETLFNLLELLYDSRDIRNAAAAIDSGNKTLRASGVEFLDNLLKKELKSFLMPIVELAEAEDISYQGKKVFQIKIASTEQACETLLEGEDPWLAACLLFSLPQPIRNKYQELARTLAGATDPILRETAEWILVRSSETS